MMGFIRDGNYQMPLRPLEGTAPGHLFAEPVGHRRPGAVGTDRHRNHTRVSCARFVQVEASGGLHAF